MTAKPIKKDEIMTCNCGRPIRYYKGDSGSCNKYSICPTYNELQEQVESLNVTRRKYEQSLNAIVNSETLLACKYHAEQALT